MCYESQLATITQYITFRKICIHTQSNNHCSGHVIFTFLRLPWYTLYVRIPTLGHDTSPGKRNIILFYFIHTVVRGGAFHILHDIVNLLRVGTILLLFPAVCSCELPYYSATTALLIIST